MKKLFSLFSLCLCMLVAHANTTVEIKHSTINSVRLYQTAAQVYRTAKIQVEKGISEIQILDIAADINEQSISVSGKGSFTILSVRFNKNYLSQTEVSKEVKALRDSLDWFSERLVELQNNKSVLDEEQSLILANKAVGGTNTGLNVESLKLAAEFLRNRLSEIKSKMIIVNQRIKKTNERIVSLNQQLNEQNSRLNQPTGMLTVSVSANIATQAQLDFSYISFNAGWTPMYDIRVKNIQAPVELTFKAAIHQNTREDWKNVQLQLSTGNPLENQTQPDLQPFYINFVQPPRVFYRGSRDDGALMKTEDANSVLSAESPISANAKSLSEYVVINNNQLTTDYAIGIPFSVLGNGKEAMVEVKEYSLNASYRYYAVPKLDRDAFLIARVVGWEGLSLLPGNASIYFEGSYIGENSIGASTNDTLELSLGRDKNIIIKREKTKDLSGQKTFSDNQFVKYTFKITVKNLRKEPINLLLQDQLPISNQKEIEVKLVDSEKATLDTESGKLSWDLTLKAGEESIRKFSYSITYPNDRKINLPE